MCQPSCLGYCRPGTISQTGLEPCTACPAQYYQLEHGATGCLPCTDEIDDIQCYIRKSTAYSFYATPTFSGNYAFHYLYNVYYVYLIHL